MEERSYDDQTANRRLEDAADNNASGRDAARRVSISLGNHRECAGLKIRVPATRIGDILHGRRGITPDTALRLARFFGNSPEFWLTLQQMQDLSKAKLELGETIEREVDEYSAA